MPHRIALGSDHAGFALKQMLEESLQYEGYAVGDLGAYDEESTDYPDFAHAVAEAVLDGSAEFGVLVCGTGVGMAMTANRHPGIRAAVCSETFSARMARAHNDSNVLCLGARVVGTGLAQDILHAFLSAEFEEGRHVRRVRKIEHPGTDR